MVNPAAPTASLWRPMDSYRDATFAKRQNVKLSKNSPSFVQYFL
jgi:hypothetical protein